MAAFYNYLWQEKNFDKNQEKILIKINTVDLFDKNEYNIFVN